MQSARAAWRDLGAVLAFGLLALGVVVWLARAVPAPPRVPFDERPLKRLKNRRPNLVLIGNSMVYSRFEGTLLNRLVSPARVEILALGGSRSAIWYAQLKYTVVASGVRPRVAFFFREKELTLPRGNLRTSNSEILQRVTPGRDPVIESKIGRRGRDRSDAFSEVVPLERLRAAAWEPVDELALSVSTALAPGPEGARRKTEINRLFGVEALRAGAAETREPSEPRGSVSKAIERSFLPEIFVLARENRIPLTFVRVRTRSFAEGKAESAEQTQYAQALRAYLEKNGARYLDLTKNDWETPDLYGQGDHIAKRHRAEYTQRFVASHPDFFREPP